MNEGDNFKFNESVSFAIPCKDQNKIDHYWYSLIANGASEKNIGWCKDKAGLSCQVVPTILGELMSNPNILTFITQLPPREFIITSVIKAAFLRRFPSINRNLPNPEKNPLLDEINKLEIEYSNLKAKKVHAEFTNKDLTKLKTQDEIFKEYIAHLKKKIAEEAQNAANANSSRRSQPSNQLMIKKEEKTKN